MYVGMGYAMVPPLRPLHQAARPKLHRTLNPPNHRNGKDMTQALDTLSIYNFQPTNLTIHCGGGQVVIAFDTGKVTLNGCTLDEGAKAFWDAVERMRPAR